MEIKQVIAVSWSATGNTQTIVQYIGKQLAEKLQIPYKFVDFTPFENRRHVMGFSDSDLVVVGSPTYAGKLPNKILPDFQSMLSGNNALAVAVVTFGNRSFDNALAELCRVLRQDGFSTVAAAAFSCRHAFSDRIAPTRPDGEDLAQARKFAGQIAAYVTKLQSEENTGEGKFSVNVAGDADGPYYIPKGIDGNPAKFLKAKPVTDSTLCDGCGLCASVCPMQSIDPQNVADVQGVCIKCQSCIRKCPNHAKYFDDPAFLSHVAMLEANYTERRENVFYLGCG